MIETSSSIRQVDLEPSTPSTSCPGLHAGVEIDRRRLLGAYYTPDDLAGVLTRWALVPGVGTVLDPSFGGCAFLNAAAKILATKGAENPGRLVVGVDVDPACVEYVRASEDLVEENCIVRDFLALSPANVSGAPFQAVVGNPPYVRHHWLKGPARSAARAAIGSSGVSLPARASTWAYFLVHALDFLAPNGRLAMLVPEAILQADYAAPVRRVLAARFGRVRLIHIRDRLFENTDEPVVVVAASGYGRRGRLSVDAVKRAEELDELLSGSTGERGSRRVTGTNGRGISAATVRLLKDLEKHDAVRKVADLATVRIGFVTGANNHFIRSDEDLGRLGVPSEARLPVVSRTKWLSGLEFTERDHQEVADAGRRAFLVRPTPACDLEVGVQRWIADGIRARVHERFKCASRAVWYRMTIAQPPDAFATCTRLGSPLLVLNRAGYPCTNALHSVRWSCQSKVVPEAAAVGFLTSVVSVWAELHGRRYGRGVLKMEPGALNRVPVPLVQGAEDSFGELNDLVRGGREDEARRRADHLVLGDGLGLPKSKILRLQRVRSALMSERDPARGGGAGG